MAEGDYDVVTTDVLAASRNLADDAEAIASACSDGAAAAFEAGNACRGGPLAAALVAFQDAISRFGDRMGGAATDASSALNTIAGTYEETDAAARATLDAALN